MKIKELHRAHPRPRVGKTEKDRQNGAHATALTNREQRVDWHNSTSPRPTNLNFPVATCNGKKNRLVR